VLAPSAPAQTGAPTPSLLNVRLGAPAIVGRENTVIVDAQDTRATVSGMVVRFGRRQAAFGLSACRVQIGFGRIPRAFRLGARVRLSVPHRFSRMGEQQLMMRVDSGGCLGERSSIYQTVPVVPTAPGRPRRPVVPDRPSPLEPVESLLPPLLPTVPGVPSLPDLLDDLLPGAGATDARSKRRGCPGSGKRLGRSRKSIRRTRRALLCLLNKARRRRGLSPLRANRRLTRAATLHSVSMVRRHFFSHFEPGGASPLDRIQGSGYLAGAHAYVYGENIGFGERRTSSARSMMRAWMNSSPHRANILTRGFREVGLGVARGIPGRSRARGGTYTTVFGVRR
jgi:Cysteine-rich secretory protein family